MVNFELVFILHCLDVAPADLVFAKRAEDLSDDVLAADEVLFNINAFHYVSSIDIVKSHELVISKLELEN